MRTAALRQLNHFFHSVIAIVALSAVAIFVLIVPVRAQEETADEQGAVEEAPTVEEVAPAEEAEAEPAEEPTEETSIPSDVAEAIAASAEAAPPPEEIALDTEVSAADLGTTEPRVLPDSPFYRFKEWGRRVRRFFIRNPVARAEEDLRVATQRLLEAERLVDVRGEAGAGQAEALARRATLGLSSIADARIAAGDPERVARFEAILADRTFKMQRMFEHLEGRVPEEALARIRENKERALEHTAGVFSRIESNPEDLARRLSEAAENQPGSEFKHFKNLEVLKELEDRALEDARDAIRRAEEDGLRRLKEDIEGAPIQEREKFGDYVRYLPGDAVRHFEILDDLRTETELAPDFLPTLDAIKAGAAEKFREQFEEHPEIRENILKSFREGNVADLRVAEQLSHQLPPEISGQVRAAQDDGIRRFQERFAGDPNALRASELARKALENPDAVDFAVLERIRESLSPGQQEFISGLEDEAARRVSEEADRRGEEFTERFADPNAPQSLEVLENLRDRLPEESRQGIDRAIEVQRMRFDEHIRELDDPRVLRHIQDSISGDEGLKRSFEAGDPEFFTKIEARRDDLLRSGEEMRREIEERVRPLFEHPDQPIPENLPEPVRRELERFREWMPRKGEGGPFPVPSGGERRERAQPFGEPREMTPGEGERPMMPPPGVRPEDLREEMRERMMERKAPRPPEEMFRREGWTAPRPLPFGTPPPATTPPPTDIRPPEGSFVPPTVSSPPPEGSFQPPPDGSFISPDGSLPPPPEGETRPTSFLGGLLALLNGF